jgi:hypothetical protein
MTGFWSFMLKFNCTLFTVWVPGDQYCSVAIGHEEESGHRFDVEKYGF